MKCSSKNLMHECQPGGVGGADMGSYQKLKAVQPLSGRERRCEVAGVNYSPTVNNEKEEV